MSHYICIPVIQKINVKYLKALCSVRYWDDAKVNGKKDKEGNIPCRQGDTWEPCIDLDTGIIVNWTQGVTAEVYYKVCDAGAYKLLNEKLTTVFDWEGYVPTMMCPEGNGYGDYVIMKIDENGKIDKWKVCFQGIDDLDEEYNS